VTFYKNRIETAFSPAVIGFSGVIDSINDTSPDIVHLHWICAAMIKLEDLRKINAPIVWSLHDMWAFTGGCHYDEECQAYEQNCGNCIVLRSTKEHDLSRKVYRRKEKVFAQIGNMTIVGLSRWLSECAKKSSLLKDKTHISLPNPIDTNLFKPFDKQKARGLWDLPTDKYLILFGAMGATSDPRKGFKELKEALAHLINSNIELVVFGSNEPKESQKLGFKTHYLGYLHDDVSLVTLYNAVDIMIVPSLQEAFGQTASESMSCGIPVVAFGSTGLLDIVDHKVNGYLAKPFESDDLALGTVSINIDFLPPHTTLLSGHTTVSSDIIQSTANDTLHGLHFFSFDFSSICMFPLTS